MFRNVMGSGNTNFELTMLCGLLLVIQVRRKLYIFGSGSKFYLCHYSVLIQSMLMTNHFCVGFLGYLFIFTAKYMYCVHWYILINKCIIIERLIIMLKCFKISDNQASLVSSLCKTIQKRIWVVISYNGERVYYVTIPFEDKYIN